MEAQPVALLKNSLITTIQTEWDKDCLHVGAVQSLGCFQLPDKAQMQWSDKAAHLQVSELRISELTAAH